MENTQKLCKYISKNHTNKKDYLFNLNNFKNNLNTVCLEVTQAWPENIKIAILYLLYFGYVMLTLYSMKNLNSQKITD